jgi:hypothetical protein
MQEQTKIQFIASIASSASNMEREALVTRVVELETQFALQESQKARTKKENEDLHANVLRVTKVVVDNINTMDMYRLWWVEQVLNERKTS